MRLAEFTRKLVLPTGFEPPRRLVHEGIVATALCRDDLREDVDAINSNVELIQRTRGGDWPDGPVDDDFDYADLVWHEVEFREGFSFGFALRDSGGRYIGCAYLYPMGVRTEITEALAEHDVDASWWVTAEAYSEGYYERVHAALRRWATEDFPFSNPYWSNREIPGIGQV